MATEPVNRPSPRRRGQRVLSSVPLRLLRRIIEDVNPNALRAVHDDYLTEDEQGVYQFVRGHYSSHGRFPDFMTLEERRIVLPDAPEPLEFYRNEFLNSIRLRQVADAMMRVQEAITANDGEAAIDAMQTQQIDRGAAVSHNTLRTLLPVVQEGLNPVNSLNRIIETGIPAVDEHVGGIGAGDIGFLYGRPAAGKTMMQLAGVLNLAESGRRVLLITKEMSDWQIAHRMLALYTNVDPQVGMQRRISTHAYQEIMRRLQHEVPDAVLDNIIIPDPTSLRTTEDVKHAIREHQPYLTAVDGTYFVEPVNVSRSANRTERLEAVIREFKAVAFDTGQAILATWQQNRGKGMDAGSMYGTDAATQDAALAIEIKHHRQDRSMRVMVVTKNRHGPQDFEFGVTYRFKPTSLGITCAIPRRGDDNDAANDTRAERMRDRAVTAARTQRPTDEVPE